MLSIRVNHLELLISILTKTGDKFIPLNQQPFELKNVQNHYSLATSTFMVDDYFDMTAFQQMLEDLTF